MQYVELDGSEWDIQRRRALVIGGPNTRKTTSLFTCKRPLIIQVYPGELGSASIRREEGVKAFVPKLDPEKPAAPGILWNMTVRTTKEILSGKYGPVTTFAGDGIHKLYQVIYDMELAALIASGEEKAAKPGGKEFDVEDVRGRAYGLAHARFLKYLRDVSSSGVEYVIFTCWAAKEKKDREDWKSKPFYYPDLPGNLAKWMLGEFPVVLYAQVTAPLGPQDGGKATWIIKPQGDVKGVGVKGPVEIVKKLPPVVPQDWQALDRMLAGNPAETPTQEVKA